MKPYLIDSHAHLEMRQFRSDLEQVLDSDVQRAVNGLWAAGAEAVSVNGSRLTARSAIRSAAGAILVAEQAVEPVSSYRRCLWPTSTPTPPVSDVAGRATTAPGSSCRRKSTLARRFFFP